MKRVLCLYRVSSKGQVDQNDIPMQRIACREYIAQHSDWVLYDEKLEKGVSGFKLSADKRDKIIEIRKEAEQKKFDILLVFMSDRLGRRDDETPFLVEWFINHGIEVWSVKDGQICIENHTDKLINYIRFWQASGESLKTSQRVSTRQQQMVEEGIWRGGARPYGYDLVFKGRIGKKNRQLLDLEKNPKEASIVEEIFSLCCDSGFGTHRIANYLNARYPDPAKVWTPQTVISILRNPLYTGRMHFNDTQTKEPLEHLRIVSDERFRFAARVLKERIPKKYAIGEDQCTKTDLHGASLLSGILYCAHCDHKLVGTYHTKVNSHGERTYRPIYRCYNGAVEAKNCSGQRTYSAARIEEVVLKVVRQYFSTFGSTVDELWREQVKLQLQRNRGSEMKQAQAELNKLQNRRAKLMEEATKALTGESVYDAEMIRGMIDANEVAVSAAEATIQRCRSEQAEIDAKIRELSDQYSSIQDWAEVFDTADVDEKKMILARIIEKITVNRNYEITIRFFLTLDDFKRAFEEDCPDNTCIEEAKLSALA